MRADWTASGACTSGSTAHPRGAMRRASGGAATTRTTRAERTRGDRPLDRDAPLLLPALELPGPSTSAGRRAHADAVVLEQVGRLLRNAPARKVRWSPFHHEACGVRKPDLHHVALDARAFVPAS